MKIELRSRFSYEDGVNIDFDVEKWRQDIIAKLMKGQKSMRISSGRGFVQGEVHLNHLNEPIIDIFIVRHGYVKEIYNLIEEVEGEIKSIYDDTRTPKETRQD